jgi:poly(3-hydroxybutyrate) depolymerase
MSTIKTFPQEICVRVATDDEDFMIAYPGGFAEALENEDSARIAVYELRSVHDVRKAPPLVTAVKSKNAR